MLSLPAIATQGNFGKAEWGVAIFWQLRGQIQWVKNDITKLLGVPSWICILHIPGVPEKVEQWIFITLQASSHVMASSDKTSSSEKNDIKPRSLDLVGSLAKLKRATFFNFKVLKIHHSVFLLGHLVHMLAAVLMAFSVYVCRMMNSRWVTRAMLMLQISCAGCAHGQPEMALIIVANLHVPLISFQNLTNLYPWSTVHLLVCGYGQVMKWYDKAVRSDKGKKKWIV